MDVTNYHGGSSPTDRLKNLRKSSNVANTDEMYSLSFEDFSTKLEKIDGELSSLKKYNGKIVDKYNGLDCFRFDREFIRTNYSDLSDSKKIERGLLYLMALKVQKAEVKKEEEEDEKTLQRRMDRYDLDTMAFDSSGREDELQRTLEALKGGNEEIHGGLKTRRDKSGDIETFLQRMEQVTKGKPIFTDKQRKRLEYELAKFIKGEKSGNLTEKSTEIINFEKLYLRKFKTWLNKFSKFIRIDVNDKFNEVFEDINGLQLTTKSPQSGDDKQIVEFIAKYDDKTGYELKEDHNDNYNLSADAQRNYDNITGYENSKTTQEKIISQNKRLIEDLRGSRGDGAEGQKQTAINAKIVAETALEDDITPELTALKANVDKNQKDAKVVLESIKTEYKKALAKIEEKYKDKKDEKVKDTGTKTPLNLATKDDIEEIDKIFGELDEFSVELEQGVKDELNDALHKAIVGEFSGGQVGGAKVNYTIGYGVKAGDDTTFENKGQSYKIKLDFDINPGDVVVLDTETGGMERVSRGEVRVEEDAGEPLGEARPVARAAKETQIVQESIEIKFNGKKLEGSTLNDIKNNIDEIRKGYSSITGDPPSLQKIIDILNQRIPVEYVINDGLRIFVYGHFIKEFAKEIKKRQEEVDKYMDYAEGKFGDDQLSSLRVKRGLRKRIVDAGLKELLQVILTVTFREYQEKYMVKMKQEIVGKLSTVKDENIRKLLYSLETNKRLKDEIISVDKELEPTLMEFVKLLKKEETDEKTKEEEEKKKKEEEKKKSEEEKLKKKEEDKRKKEEERKKKEEEKRKKKEEEKRKKEEQRKKKKDAAQKSPDKSSETSKSSRDLSGDKTGKSDSFDDTTGKSDSLDDTTGKSDSLDDTTGKSDTSSSENITGSLLNLEPSETFVGLSEQDYNPASDEQNKSSIKTRSAVKLRKRLEEERIKTTNKMNHLKKQLKDLKNMKDEDKETKEHIIMERHKLIEEFKKAIRRVEAENKDLEKKYRIDELKLIEDKNKLVEGNADLLREKQDLLKTLQSVTRNPPEKRSTRKGRGKGPSKGPSKGTSKGPSKGPSKGNDKTKKKEKVKKS